MASFFMSVCVFSFLFCSTTHCVPVTNIEGDNIDLKLGYGNAHSVLGVSSALFSVVELCKEYFHARNQKVLCLFCKGIDLSCLISTTTTTKHPTSTLSTTPVSTSTITSTSTTSTLPTVTTAAEEAAE